MSVKYKCPGCKMEFTVDSKEVLKTIYDEIHSIHNKETYDYTKDIVEVK